MSTSLVYGQLATEKEARVSMGTLGGAAECTRIEHSPVSACY